MATILWLSLVAAYAWSAWSLHRQGRHDGRVPGEKADVVAFGPLPEVRAAQSPAAARAAR